MNPIINNDTNNSGTRITPRNNFNCRLADRYWQVPTAIPRATHYNVPIGTQLCDQLGFICHPQQYQTFHKDGYFEGKYPNIDVESSFRNLDYYNVLDIDCQVPQQLSPELIDSHFSGPQRGPCQTTPRLWNNTTKLFKYNQY
tara:strand:- start:7273 stop:7698 length:426 start_codon:yes stop_codon:yes gene_type:complete